MKWHKYIQFLPHTNYNVLTIGCYPMDTDMKNERLAVKPSSRNQPLFDQYDSDGNWTCMLSNEYAATIDMSDVDYLTGPAGSITIHNARTLHFSVQHITGPAADAAELFHLADAKPYTPHPGPVVTRLSDRTAKRSDGRLTIHAPEISSAGLVRRLFFDLCRAIRRRYRRRRCNAGLVVAGVSAVAST